MPTHSDTLTVRTEVRHGTTGWPIGGADVEATARSGRTKRVVASGRTDPDGLVELEVDTARWEGLSVRVAGSGDAVVLTPAHLLGEELVTLQVDPAARVDKKTRAMLADYLVSTRRVRAGDVATDLARPGQDSLLRLVPAPERMRLLDDVLAAVPEDRLWDDAEAHIVDPDALRDGGVQVVPIRDLDLDLDPDLDLEPLDPDRVGLPHLWDRFHWALPDDQSYRDYLRGVVVLFAHQQKLGVGADPLTFPAVVERQLTRRFFQNFRTSDRNEAPLNRMLIPIVRAILVAPKDDGFGFAIPAGSVPAQGTLTDREHLDALLALAPVSVPEFANRYRLPLTEPDSSTSTPVLLNVRTLSRILSDTAQGPVEPENNVIVPQLPGEQGKPFLWFDVVGSAPFFLRFDEWLARQQPFFPENLFALRTQVIGTRQGPWLNEARKTFLDYHAQRPLTWSMTPYNPYFGSIDEVHRSAAFLQRYGAADAKLVELVHAIDKSQYAAAARLADEAERLLNEASPSSKPGEDWEPDTSVGFPRPLSFAKRRKLKVTTIAELVGSGTTYPPDGFEPFFTLATPTDVVGDIVHFRIARDQATRLRVYQLRFVLPLLRALARTGLGDLPGAIEALAGVTGFQIGIGMLGTPAGMVRHPDAISAKRVVAGRFHWNDPLGDRPYTARLMYDKKDRFLVDAFPVTPQLRQGYDALTAEPEILHPLEERYARIVQADALLAWAETLYRTDDAANLERARELYKAVVFLHGEDPGTSAYLPFTADVPWFGLVENPRARNQLDRARLALHQLDAGLNFYGYRDDAVPTLRYDTLAGVAGRWVAGARTAQSDYLSYLGKVEQSDLDLLSANAQQRKAQAGVAIAAEQVEIAKAGVVVAQKLVTDVEKLIAAKESEIADAKSLFHQFSDYFSGMKSSVSSMVDVGKGAAEGYTAVSSSGVGEALGLGESGAAGAGAGASAETVGLGSAMGGLGVVGGFAAFAVLSTITLQGMADAEMKRDGELKALKNEALPAARAAVRTQERHVAIANLLGQIAATELAYARDLVAYQNERFLNRDFWDALTGVAGRALHRYLDLAGQAAWFAERALAYQLAAPIRIVRLGYFDARMRDLGGVDRLALDLAELEAVRIGAARVTVPITRTYSLARDLPLAFGELKKSGGCTFTLTDDDLLSSHPGTYGHRIKAVDVVVEAPGTGVRMRGILTNRGFSLLRRAPGAARVPLLRFADAYPVSEFRVRGDLGLHEMPGESLLPFEGTAFTTTWSLELPRGANAAGLARVTDVLITFDVRAGYDAGTAEPTALPAAASRSMFVSALAVGGQALASLRKAGPTATLEFPLHELAVPGKGKITNLAVLLPGVDGGSYPATVKVGGAAAKPFTIDQGLAMSNAGGLVDGEAARPLNAAIGASPAKPVTVTIDKTTDAKRLKGARDVLLWIEYEVPA